MLYAFGALLHCRAPSVAHIVCTCNSQLLHAPVLAPTACFVPLCCPQLLGPDSQGLAAFRLEARAYHSLQAVQGVAVPRLLAAGSLDAGVRVIATARVEGRPLSDLPSIPAPIAAAAELALSRVHAACPGLCQGDVRLANVIVQEPQPGAGSGGGGHLSGGVEPRCMVVDFGRAWFGASTEQQQAELQQLRRLLRARAPS